MTWLEIYKKLTDWLVRQRTETVVLLAILGVLVGGVGYATVRGLPWAMAQVQAHIDSLTLANERQVERISHSFDKATESFERSSDRQFELIGDLLKSRNGGTVNVPFRTEHAIRTESTRPHGISD